jgi:hypothetical protein
MGSTKGISRTTDMLRNTTFSGSLDAWADRDISAAILFEYAAAPACRRVHGIAHESDYGWAAISGQRGESGWQCGHDG